MSRIIAAALAATLTACSSPAERAPAARGDTPAAAPDTPAAAGPRQTAADTLGAVATPAVDAAPTAGGLPGAAAGGDSARVILFLGNSLTAGYGVGPDSAFPAVIGRWIAAAGLPYRVSNAGISGETSAGGLRRIAWSLQSPVDVLVLELGANDGLRGIDPGHMRANLDSIIVLARARYPDCAIVIAGMEAPPNLGERYTAAFRRVFPELARQHHAALVPFLLAGVAAVDSLNQSDGIHPTATGHRLLAANVWRVLEPLLRHRAQRAGKDSS